MKIDEVKMSRTNFSGYVVYDGEKMATRVRRLEFKDKKVVLDLIHPPEDGDHTLHFLGVAERQANGIYKTPWKKLTDESGVDLANGWGAQITFTIEGENSSELKIVGEWTDLKKGEYPFKGLLHNDSLT